MAFWRIARRDSFVPLKICRSAVSYFHYNNIKKYCHQLYRSGRLCKHLPQIEELLRRLDKVSAKSHLILYSIKLFDYPSYPGSILSWHNLSLSNPNKITENSWWRFKHWGISTNPTVCSADSGDISLLRVRTVSWKVAHHRPLSTLLNPTHLKFSFCSEFCSSRICGESLAVSVTAKANATYIGPTEFFSSACFVGTMSGLLKPPICIHIWWL